MMTQYIIFHKKYSNPTNQIKMLKNHTKNQILISKLIFYQFFNKNFIKNHKILYFWIKI